MWRVVTTDEMRKIEQAADAGGLSYEEMMSNAGAAVAQAILDRWPEPEGADVLILAGPGNNGGDGLVAGYHLIQAGANVEVYLSHSRTASDDHNFARLVEAGARISDANEDQDRAILEGLLQGAALILDALLGTGINLPLRGTPKSILDQAKRVLTSSQTEPFIVAVDCPSGLDCDTGQVAEETLAADLTVTLAAGKPGLFEFPGASTVGELVVGSIGLPQGMKELEAVEHFLPGHDALSGWLPDRPLDAHKGTFGRCLIIAGSIDFPGAAGLAGLGAYRSGAGLVTLAVPSPIQGFLTPILPEATWIPLPHEKGFIAAGAAAVIRPEMSSVDAMLIGPGFGRKETSRLFIEQLLSLTPGDGSKDDKTQHSRRRLRPLTLPPCVVDADGLKLISGFDNWPKLFSQTAVLTPHPGEFAVMTGLSTAEVQKDRAGLARRFAEMWGQIVVLKGAFTVVAAPDGRLATIPIATPALATAGTGDVLAGVIVSLRGQRMGGFEAAVLGAYAHASAGTIAAERVGASMSVMAGDIVDHLPEAFARIKVGGG